METKKYEIVNSFEDVHTGEQYTSTHEPVAFTKERVEEIQRVEKLIGYTLIKECKTPKKEIKETKEK